MKANNEELVLFCALCHFKMFIWIRLLQKKYEFFCGYYQLVMLSEADQVTASAIRCPVTERDELFQFSPRAKLILVFWKMMFDVSIWERRSGQSAFWLHMLGRHKYRDWFQLHQKRREYKNN
jgi:hypothetical protein